MDNKRINYILLLLSSCKEQYDILFKDFNYLNKKYLSNVCLKKSINYLNISKTLLFRFKETFISLLSSNNISNMTFYRIKELYIERSYYNLSICKSYYAEYISSLNKDEKTNKYNIVNKISYLQKTLDNVIKNIEIIR